MAKSPQLSKEMLPTMYRYQGVMEALNQMLDNSIFEEIDDEYKQQDEAERLLHLNKS